MLAGVIVIAKKERACNQKAVLQLMPWRGFTVNALLAVLLAT
jgi:hypothetical protein